MSPDKRKMPIIFSIFFLSILYILLNVSVFASANPMINEFESNPPGNDNSGEVEEWVELYNPTSDVIDIGNWTLTTGYKTIIETIPEDTLIEPGEYYIVSRRSVWLVNAEEYLILRNALGEEIDRTPVKHDSDNNASSWSRYPNGYDSDVDADWVYQPSTRAEPNSGDVSIPTLNARLPLEGNVTVHFINVGQGDSIFVDTPDSDMLIDGGYKYQGDTVVAYLQRLGITRIDYIVLTHPDRDHIGGLSIVFSAYDGDPEQTVIDNFLERDDTVDDEYVRLRGTRDHVIAFRGHSFLLDDCVNVTVLNPVIPLQFSGSNSRQRSQARNENSVVLKMVVGEVVFLFMGDAGEQAETSILNARIEVDASILKVGHHGSAYSTSDRFLNDVDPNVAVICVGTQHGHPSPTTITNLENSGARIATTHDNGDVIITTDGIGYEVLAEFIDDDGPAGIPAEDDIIPTRMIAIGILIAEFFVIFRERLR